MTALLCYGIYHMTTMFVLSYGGVIMSICGAVGALKSKWLTTLNQTSN